MKIVTLKCEQVTDENGQLRIENFFLNDQLHNEHGPAICFWYENGQLQTERFFLNDQLHNEHGPAIRSWYENGQLLSESFYLKGEKLTESEWKARTACQPDQKCVIIDGQPYKLVKI